MTARFREFAGVLFDRRRRADAVRKGLGVALCAAAAAGLSISGARAQDEGAIVDHWLVATWTGKCIASEPPLKTIVFGLDRDSTSFNPAQLESLKDQVRALLSGQAPSAVTITNQGLDLKAYTARLQGGADPRALTADILNDNKSDLLVFIHARRERDKAVYSLIGYTAKGECARTPPEALNVKLPGEVPKSLDVALGEFRGDVEAEATHNDQNVADIDLCPVAPKSGGSHSCSGPLQERLLDTLLRSADPPLSNRPKFEVTEISESACRTSDKSRIMMTYGPSSKAGVLNITLKLMKGDKIVKTEPSEVDDLPSGCDPAEPEISLQEEIAGGAHVDKARLQIVPASARFSVGDPLDVRITTGGPANLYCWGIDADNTGAVFMPKPAAGSFSSVPSANTWSYPSDFGAGRQVLRKAEKALFGCFSSRAPLPPDVQREWLSKWCVDGSHKPAPRLLDKDAIRRLAEMTRRVDGVSEAYAWLDVGGASMPAGGEENVCEAAK
jgi:hypothetical protein